MNFWIQQMQLDVTFPFREMMQKHKGRLFLSIIDMCVFFS